MIIEERTYRIKPGQLDAYLALYDDGPRTLQQSILGHLVGYFTTESGDLNNLVHLWAYDSLEDRSRRRAQLAAAPEWQTYIQSCTPLILKMSNRFLSPLPFSPLR
ncbi:NIPSNAP family protein [Pelagibacterium sp.]|uniref:NIPSNAP family protein n=1 Tax=Pelagibacterium sp. TaxID=1967288 RepID=UPI003A92A69A